MGSRTKNDSCMTKTELIDWVSMNDVSGFSWLIFNLVDENGNEKQKTGKLEFNSVGGLAITEEAVGARIRVAKGSENTMPLVGGMKLSLIQSIELED